MIGNYIWMIWIGYFLTFEIFTLVTKEKYYPSLSRWTWRQTARWNPKVRGKGIMPLRIVLLIGMTWATLHLSFGECAFNIC